MNLPKPEKLKLRLLIPQLEGNTCSFITTESPQRSCNSRFVHAQLSRNCWEVASLTFLTPQQGWQGLMRFPPSRGVNGDWRLEENCRHSSHRSKSCAESFESHQLGDKNELKSIHHLTMDQPFVTCTSDVKDRKSREQKRKPNEKTH